MKTPLFHKSNIYLALIVLIVAGVGFGAFWYFRSDAVSDALKNDRIISVLFVLESKGEPLATEILFYYPNTRRAALFDIPCETALIMKELGRSDRVSVLFKQNNPRPYRDELQRLLGCETPIIVTLSLDQLGRLADLMDGLEVFVPNPVEITDSDKVVLFQPGTILLDGDKVKTFMTYADQNEAESDLVNRRQKSFLALLKRIAERSEYLSKNEVSRVFISQFSTNMGTGTFRKLIGLFGKIDVDRIVPQRVTGIKKVVDGQTLLFPHNNGELLKSIVKQNLNALVNPGTSGEGERVFSVDVMNGTPVNGLAKKGASLYESFGYEVLKIANADKEDLDVTVLYDRFSNPEVAKNAAAVIKCSDIRKGLPPGMADEEGGADFILMLGKDFNGRFCVQQ